MADTNNRRTANGWSNTLTLGHLACHVTARSQLPREVNKFLLAYVILLNALIFSNISCACAKEHLIDTTY